MQEFSFKYGKFAVTYHMNESIPVFHISMDFPDAVFTAHTGADNKVEMKFYFRASYRVKYFQQDEYIKKFGERDVYYPFILKRLENSTPEWDVNNLDFHVKNVHVELMRRNGGLYTGASMEVHFNLDYHYLVTKDIIDLKKAFSKAFNDYMKGVPEYDSKARDEDKRQYIQSLKEQVVTKWPF